MGYGFQYFDFNGKNEIKSNVFKSVVYLNRVLAYMTQVHNDQHLDFYTTFDNREFNPIIAGKSEIRETLIYQCLTERFTEYVCFDVDFNSCFQNILLKATGVIPTTTHIDFKRLDFKRLTAAGKTLTLEEAFKWGGCPEQKTR
jgi:hypothetical protein